MHPYNVNRELRIGEEFVYGQISVVARCHTMYYHPSDAAWPCIEKYFDWHAEKSIYLEHSTNKNATSEIIW